VSERAVFHDFNERLAFSQAQGDEEAAWVALYQDAWPELVAHTRLDANSRYQQCGVDRRIDLPHMKSIYIDEKVRDPNKAKDRDGDPYDDILIEEWSVWRGDGHPGNKVGWSLDPRKQCDYVAYALPLLQRCYLLPFELLRWACRSNLAEWKLLRDTKGRRCYPLDALNQGYKTRNCAVSWTNLQAGLSAEMKRVRTVGGLALPTPTIRGVQAEFDWVEKDK